MINKKTLYEIVNYVINHGYDEDGEIKITKLNSGRYEWEVYAFGGDKIISYSGNENSETIQIPVPEYDNFVEDMKSDLLLDLSFILTEWENSTRYRKGARITNANYSPEKRKEAAKKAWKTKRSTPDL